MRLKLNKASKSLSIKRLLTHWLIPVWVTLAIYLAFFLLSLTTSHFDWAISGRLLVVLSPILATMLFVMYVFWYLIPKWPLETALIMLAIMCIIFLLASGKDFPIASQIRDYISNNFDINYFAASMTIAGLVIAIFALYSQEKKRKRKRPIPPNKKP